MGGVKILSIIWFSFVVSPCHSQIYPKQLTDWAAFPCKPLHPRKKALSVIWCSTLLKTEQRGWGAEKNGEKAMAPLWSFYFDFFSIPFFNLSDEVWAGRGMLSQTAISLHHMRLTHRMAGRRGVCREHSQAKGEGKKIHNMKSRVGAHWYPVMFVSAASAYAPLAACPSCIHRYKNAPNAAFHKSHLTCCKMFTLMQVNKWVRYSHKMVVSWALLGPSLRWGCSADTLIMWVERMENSCASTVVAFRVPSFIRPPRGDACNLLVQHRRTNSGTANIYSYIQVIILQKKQQLSIMHAKNF